MRARPAGAGTTSTWLGAVATALIVYATLYPLSGWDHPAGWGAWRVVELPWPRHWTGFDVLSNVLGYVPLGLLLALSGLRARGWAAWKAWALAVAAAAALSLALECLQSFLPGRVPSLMDLACNAGGAAVGATLGLVWQAAGWADGWETRHDRWIRRAHAGGTTLLVLWPLALLFPTPVPLGLGQIFEPVGEWVGRLVVATPVEAWLRDWAGPLRREVPVAGLPRRLSAAAEAGVVAAAMLAPCMLAFTLSPVGWRRGVLAVGALALALGVLTLSTALNFGPQNALAWRTTPALVGMVAGTLVAVGLSWVPARLAAGVGLLALGAMLVGVALAPADPYDTLSLASWEQGRFIRFHGASQWIGWLWPFAAVFYLLGRLARPPGASRGAS